MRVRLCPSLNDAHLDAAQAVSQRQLALSISAMPESTGRTVPLNLCLILDHSGSMHGRPLETVRQAAQRLVEQLSPGDRISVIAFDHKAKVLVPNQLVHDSDPIKSQIGLLRADGGTAIDEGLRLGIEELAKSRKDMVSQAFLLTDGENEHGDNDRCLKLAHLAAGYNLTLNTLGFGNHWNQDILEQIADAGGGTMAYIEQPEKAIGEFGRLFQRMQSVGLTNAFLQLNLSPNVRLAELKPIAQVAPDAIELPLQEEEGWFVVRLGDLMIDVPRVVLANLYLHQLPPGQQTIGRVQVRYDDPIAGQEGAFSDCLPIEVMVQQEFQAATNPEVQQYVLALAKYRQTQIAETKLRQGDRAGAATMLQTAAKTAMDLGDHNAATVLQDNATRLQAGEDLSEEDRKKTRIASKTMLQ
ncbi:hypothetical protein BST81_02580 [Leptolyngbya sp. 'hensonii']|uniref:vWA domain-containing protein n=1 Tax=Leptolyngbya sp. 'hensonii' TaxID=1922337 RepID=UPI00094FB136|nr:VWA domain-containing protein [Leptolyngbya sp. 'hensonii']OLP19977.1 hypothetical protein BST81_02580 [Leptolyngbya sp. 'hensonii']